MRKFWTLFYGIAFSVAVITLLAIGRSDRQSYWIARKAADRPAVIVQVPGEQVLLWRLHHYYRR